MKHYENVSSFNFKNVMFSQCFRTKMETCAIMEREARKVHKKQYASNRKDKVLPEQCRKGDGQ